VIAKKRAVAWFSCGASSAVAASLTLSKYKENCSVVYCDTMKNEHPDNVRFFADVERWLEQPIVRVRSTKFDTIDNVFERTRYMAGIRGARCTTELKKIPRFEYQRADDIHVFGFTVEETVRIERFCENNPELTVDFVLAEHGVSKKDCISILDAVGIQPPAMYALGYRNNNCLGCVKATSAHYWQMVRRDFPEVFHRRAQQSRELGVTLTRMKGVRIFLDELPLDYLPAEGLEDISCGPDCGPESKL